MARIVVVVLLASLLSLTFAPVTQAAPQGQVSAGWLDALKSVLDWIVARMPTPRSTYEKGGSAMIIPDGFTAPPPVTEPPPRAVYEKSSSMIVPDGLAAARRSPGQ